VILRIEETRVQLNRTIELGDGVRGASLLTPHEAETVVRFGHPRRVLDRACVRGSGGLEIVLPFRQQSQQVVRVAGGWTVTP